MSLTVIVELVSEPFAVPKPEMVADFPLKLADVISDVLKSRPVEWSM